MKNEIINRSKLLLGYTPDPVLKLFLREAGRIGDRDWREVLARAVNEGQPTDKWLPSSLVDFQLRLMQLASDFKRLEMLVREKNLVADAKIVLQLSVLNDQFKNVSKIISISPEFNKEVEALNEQLKLSLLNTDDTIDVKLAAIGKILEELLKSDSGERNE